LIQAAVSELLGCKNNCVSFKFCVSALAE